MSANAPCPNCGRINRPGAKRCASCGNVLPVSPAAPVPPPPPPQQLPRQQPPPHQPTPPRGGPTPLPPPRKPTPPQKPANKSNLPLKPWQIVAIGGGIVIVCLCLLIANAISGIFGPKATPTTTFVTVPPYASPTQTVTVAPTPTPLVVTVVVTATFAPTTAAPTTVSAPPTTLVPPTQSPTATAEPSRTFTPQPTATMSPTATSMPTPTIAPDTLITSTLDVGQTWYQQNMAMTLSNARFANVTCGSILEFDLGMENNETAQPELVISWRGEDITLVDDQNKSYELFFQPAPRSSDCAKNAPIKTFSQLSLASKASVKISIQVMGTLPDNVKAFTLTVVKAGRIQNAKWKIPVPR